MNNEKFAKQNQLQGLFILFLIAFFCFMTFAFQLFMLTAQINKVLIKTSKHQKLVLEYCVCATGF
jgi:hypothetical protein